MKNTEVKPKLYNTNEAAEYLGIRPNTLAIWLCTKRYAIRSIKIGRLRRFRKEDLDAFLRRGEEDTGDHINKKRLSRLDKEMGITTMVKND